MRIIAFGFAAVLVLCSATRAAPDEDEVARKSPGLGDKIKSDARDFGRGMKKGGADVGHQIAKGAKRTAAGFKEAVKRPNERKSKPQIEPENKRKRSGGTEN
jgi:hypothetical protein